jgi:hydrogenase nickel incorporation protein HypA/HybF
MHELSIASAVVATAERHAQGRRVTAVSVRAGSLRQVVPESLDFYFEIVARGTSCDGARLEIEVVPARLRCESCGHQWVPETPGFRCESCGHAKVEVVAGDELEVESIEISQEEACIAPR